MKKVERLNLNIQHLCYDNRILIILYLPFCEQFQNGDRLSYKFPSKNGLKPKLDCYWKKNGPSYDVKTFRRYIMKFFYGYFRTDATRKIYFLNWRMFVGLFLPITKNKHLMTIKISDFIPIGSRTLTAFTTLVSRSYRTEDRTSYPVVNFDFTGVRSKLSSLSYWTRYCTKDFFEKIGSCNLKLDFLQYFVFESFDYFQKVSILDFNKVVGNSSYICTGGYDIDFSEERKSSIMEYSRCRSLDLRFSKKRVFTFYPSFFHSFSNLRYFSIKVISFRTCFHRNDFFRNLRKHAPSLNGIYLNQINILKETELEAVSEPETEENLLSLLTRNNQTLEELNLELEEQIFQDVNDQFNYQNNVLRVLMFRNFFRKETVKIRKSFFSRVFQCFLRVNNFGFRSVFRYDALHELNEVIRELPPQINDLKLVFPNLRFPENILDYGDDLPPSCELLVSSLASKRHQIIKLSIGFMTTLTNRLFLFRILSDDNFPNLIQLSLNDRTYFPGGSDLVDDVQYEEFYPSKNLFMLFRDNMKKLKTLYFCYGRVESLIYFLKFCPETQHIRFATTEDDPSNSPFDPFLVSIRSDDDDDEEEQEEEVYQRYMSDYLFYHEFERGVEYFEGSVDRKLRLKNFARRRRQDFESRKEMNGRTPDPTFFVESEVKEEKVREDELIKLLRERIEDNEICQEKKSQIMKSFSGTRYRLKGSDFIGVQLLKVISNFSYSTNLERKLTYNCVFEVKQFYRSTDENHDLGVLVTHQVLNFSGFRIFSRKTFGGYEDETFHEYDFASPSLLDFLRFCVSQDLPSNEEENLVEQDWISRENFIRLICSMVGIDAETDVIFVGGSDQSRRLHTKWIFREAQRIYGIRFQELDDDDKSFLDCMFD